MLKNTCIYPDSLFFQFFYTGRVGVWAGRYEVLEYSHWASVVLDFYEFIFGADVLEKLDFYIGSQLAYPLLTSDGWTFRFFSRREFSRPVSDVSVHLLGTGLTSANFNLKHILAGRRSDNLSLDWFSIYLGYLFHLDLSLPDILFRSFDGNFYRVFCDGDFFDDKLDWSVVRYGLDAVDYRSLILTDKSEVFSNVC